MYPGNLATTVADDGLINKHVLMGFMCYQYQCNVHPRMLSGVCMCHQLALVESGIPVSFRSVYLSPWGRLYIVGLSSMAIRKYARKGEAAESLMPVGVPNGL